MEIITIPHLPFTFLFIAHAGRTYKAGKQYVFYALYVNTKNIHIKDKRKFRG
jgi:hypothetical protein